MSDYNWDDDDNEYEQPSDGGKLRKQLEKALADLKTASSERATMEKELRGLKASRSLEAKGLPAKAARFMEADGVDVTDERAVDAWLDDNNDIFNFGSKASAPSTDAPEPQAPDMPTESWERLAGLQSNALSRVEPTSVEDFDASLSEDMDGAAFLQEAAKRFGLG